MAFEIAYLHIKSSPPPTLFNPPQDEKTARLRSVLPHATRVLQSFSGNQFYILQDIDDASQAYIMGHWSSVEAHDEFQKAGKTAELVAALEDTAELLGRGIYVFNHEIGRKIKEQMKREIIGISRYNVSNEDSGDFEKVFKEGKGSMEKFSGCKLAAGWKAWGSEGETVEKGKRTLGSAGEEERREFIVLSGWDSLQKRYEFPESDQWAEYAKIKGYLKWFERRNLKLIALA